MSFLSYLKEELSTAQETSFNTIIRKIFLDFQRKNWFSKVGQDTEFTDTLTDINNNSFTVKVGTKSIPGPKRFNMYLQIYKDDKLIFAKEQLSGLDELRKVIRGIYEYGENYIEIKNQKLNPA
jgi:hypothetical protein